MRVIIFDIETTSANMSGRFDPTDMDIAVVCIHDSETNEYTSYFKEDLHKLWPILEQADALVGYNSDHFDIPLLDKYYVGDLTKIKSIDLLKEIRDVLGRRIKLDSVAEATLGRKKIGSGLDSLVWWAEGKVDKVVEYCIEDVRITKEIYEYALKTGGIKFMDPTGEVRELRLNTETWGQHTGTPLTHTLPW